MISSTAGSWLALTTKSTLTVATWWARPVARPTATISAMRSTASSIVTSSIGVPSRTTVRPPALAVVTAIPPLRPPAACAPTRPSRAARASAATGAPSTAPSPERGRASARPTSGARASTRPDTTWPAERGDEQPPRAAPARAPGQGDGAAGDGHAARRRGEHRQRRHEVVEHPVDRGDPPARVLGGQPGQLRDVAPGEVEAPTLPALVLRLRRRPAWRASRPRRRRRGRRRRACRRAAAPSGTRCPPSGARSRCAGAARRP